MTNAQRKMKVEELVAIDVHTHAEISVRDPQPPTIFQEAAQKYFKHTHAQPTIPEIAAYYRERKMACVIFSVDGLRARGFRVAIVAQQSSPGIPAGVVIRQTPAGGYQVHPGDAISIEVSR